MLKPFLNCGHSWEKGYEDEWMPRALVLLEGDGPTSDSDSGPSSSDSFAGDFGFQSWGFDNTTTNDSNTNFDSNTWGDNSSQNNTFDNSSSFQNNDGSSNFNSSPPSDDGSFSYSYADSYPSNPFAGLDTSSNYGLDSLSGQAFESGAYSGGGGWQGGGPFGSGNSNYTYGTSADQNTTGGPFGTATGRDSGGPFGGWSSGFGGPPSDVTSTLQGGTGLAPGGGLIASTPGIADRGQDETPDALSAQQFGPPQQAANIYGAIESQGFIPGQNQGPGDFGGLSGNLSSPNQGNISSSPALDPSNQFGGDPYSNISADPNQAQNYGPPSITGQDLQDLVNSVTGRSDTLPTLDPAAINAFEAGQQGRAGSRDASYFAPYAGASRTGMDMEFNPFGNYQAPPAPPNQGTQGIQGLLDMMSPNQARAGDDMPNVSQSWGGQTRAEAQQNGFLPQQANELNTQTLDAMRPDAQTINQAYQAAANSGRPGWDPAEQVAGRSVIDLPAQPFDQGRSDTFASRFGDNNQQAMPVADSPYAGRYGDQPQSQQMTPTNPVSNVAYDFRSGGPYDAASRGYDFNPANLVTVNDPQAPAQLAAMPWGTTPSQSTVSTQAPAWANTVHSVGPFAGWDTVSNPLGRDSFDSRFGDLPAARPIADTPLSQYQAPPNTMQSIMQAQQARGGEPNWDQEPNITPDELRTEDTRTTDPQSTARGSPDRGATNQPRGVDPQDRDANVGRQIVETTRQATERGDREPTRQESRAPLQVTVPGRTSSAPFGGGRSASQSQASRGGLQATMDSLLAQARSGNIRALDQLNGLISQYGNPYVGNRGITDPDVNVRGGGPTHGTGVFRR